LDETAALPVRCGDDAAVAGKEGVRCATEAVTVLLAAVPVRCGDDAAVAGKEGVRCATEAVTVLLAAVPVRCGDDAAVAGKEGVRCATEAVTKGWGGIGSQSPMTTLYALLLSSVTL